MRFGFFIGYVFALLGVFALGVSTVHALGFNVIRGEVQLEAGLMFITGLFLLVYAKMEWFLQELKEGKEKR